MVTLTLIHFRAKYRPAVLKRQFNFNWLTCAARNRIKGTEFNFLAPDGSTTHVVAPRYS